MASVKYAISAYVADGTTTDYLITWDYLDEDHIAVYVDG
ncbi:phage tail fiber domain-containing protein, partial [Klebsiella pneumoniae]